MIYFEMDCACKGSNLDKMLQPGILAALYNKKMHGFSIIQKLSENSMFNGNLPDKAGVYRYLKKMEESGLLVSEWEFDKDNTKPRRVYAITERGKHCLGNWSKALKVYEESIDCLVAEIDSVIG